jgi:hypothetical protein
MDVLTALSRSARSPLPVKATVLVLYYNAAAVNRTVLVT